MHINLYRIHILYIHKFLRRYYNVVNKEPEYTFDPTIPQNNLWRSILQGGSKRKNTRSKRSKSKKRRSKKSRRKSRKKSRRKK